MARSRGGRNDHAASPPPARDRGAFGRWSWIAGGVSLLASIAILWVLIIAPLGRHAPPEQAVSASPQSVEREIAAPPAPPVERSGSAAIRPVGRRASDEELRRQLPPGAVLAE
jgi:hypothetical protein